MEAHSQWGRGWRGSSPSPTECLRPPPCQIYSFKLKMQQNRFWTGLCSRPCTGPYDAPPRSSSQRGGDTSFSQWGLEGLEVWDRTIPHKLWISVAIWCVLLSQKCPKTIVGRSAVPDHAQRLTILPQLLYWARKGWNHVSPPLYFPLNAFGISLLVRFLATTAAWDRFPHWQFLAMSLQLSDYGLLGYGN